MLQRSARRLISNENRKDLFPFLTSRSSHHYHHVGAGFLQQLTSPDRPFGSYDQTASSGAFHCPKNAANKLEEFDMGVERFSVSKSRMCQRIFPIFGPLWETMSSSKKGMANLGGSSLSLALIVRSNSRFFSFCANNHTALICQSLSRLQNSLVVQSISESKASKQSEPSRTYSTSTTDGAGSEKGSTFHSHPQSIDDFQHEEIVGPTVERDMSAVANELRETCIELRASILTLTKFLVAIGVLHVIWATLMFFTVELPFSSVLLTQVVVSATVPFGLAFHFWQSLKPMEFFTKLEERSRLRVLTLSLQVTKALAASYQRGYGIALLTIIALSAHLISCISTFLFQKLV
eukprot:c23175_g1_i1 orf=226-1272(-)